MDFKLKMGILIFLTIVTYCFGISIINSNINDLKTKRDSIEKINQGVSILVSLSNTIYTLDDRITANIISNKDYSSESSQMQTFRDGLLIFSPSENRKLDSLMNLKFENYRMYVEDTLYCNDWERYSSRNRIINSDLRTTLRSSISNLLDTNEDKLKDVLDEYDKSYFKYMVIGCILVLVFSGLLILVLFDFTRLVRSNNRTKSTIEDLFRYIQSKK
jgi:hypothetical protein